MIAVRSLKGEMILWDRLITFCVMFKNNVQCKVYSCFRLIVPACTDVSCGIIWLLCALLGGRVRRGGGESFVAVYRLIHTVILSLCFADIYLFMTRFANFVRIRVCSTIRVLSKMLQIIVFCGRSVNLPWVEMLCTVYVGL